MSKRNNERDASAGKKREQILPCDTNRDQSGNENDVLYLLNGHFGKPIRKVSPSSSPPSKKTLTLEEISEMKSSAWKMAMAHEIAIQGNINFAESVDHNPDKTVSSQVKGNKPDVSKSNVHSSYWQLLRTELQASPPIFDHAFLVLTDLKEMLISLLPDDRITTLHKRIDELLDVDLIKQQTNHSALDFRKLSVAVIDTLAAMCAPVRDQDVANLYSIEDTVDMIIKMFQIMDIMKQDKINALVAAITPHVQEHHVQYEREKFASIISKLPDGQIATEEWLKKTYKEMSQHGTSGQSDQMGANVIGPLTVLKVAYTKLLTWNHESHNFPETVAIDQKRFADLQLELRRTILVATIILTSVPSLSSELFSHNHLMQMLKQNLTILVSDLRKFDDLATVTENIAEQVWKDATDYVQTCTSLLPLFTTQNKALLHEQLSTLTDIKQSHVYKLLENRAVAHFQATADIMTIPAGSRPPIPPVPPALKAVHNEIQSLAMTYSKLVNINRMVYGPFYSPLLKKVLGLSTSISS